MKRLVLIDGNAILHRAYHALPPLTAPDGSVVNAVYGFTSILLKLVHDLTPTHIAVAFDRPAPTFRKKLYTAYQATRPKMDDDLSHQVDKVHALVTAFGIPNYEMDGFEADDIIGTVAQKVKNKDIDQVVIVTGDRDILQLVEDEKVGVFMPTKGLSEGKLYWEKDVVERMGVKPSQIADLKALMGDASDNYPGVAGIGPKTAADLVTRFGSVEELYKAIDAKRPEAKNLALGTLAKLIAGKDDAVLSKNLATIRTNAPITFDFHDALFTTFNRPEAIAFLIELHFPSLIKRITGEEQKKPASTAGKKKKENVQQQLF